MSVRKAVLPAFLGLALSSALNAAPFSLPITLTRSGNSKPDYRIVQFRAPVASSNYGSFTLRSSPWPLGRKVLVDHALFPTFLLLLERLERGDALLAGKGGHTERASLLSGPTFGALLPVGTFDGRLEFVVDAFSSLRELRVGVRFLVGDAAGEGIEVHDTIVVPIDNAVDPLRTLQTVFLRPWMLPSERPTLCLLDGAGAKARRVRPVEWRESGLLAEVQGEGGTREISFGWLRMVPPDVAMALDSIQKVQKFLPPTIYSQVAVGTAGYLATLFPDQAERVLQTLTLLSREVPGLVTDLLPQSLDPQLKEHVVSALTQTDLSQGWVGLCADLVKRGAHVLESQRKKKPGD